MSLISICPKHSPAALEVRFPAVICSECSSQGTTWMHFRGTGHPIPPQYLNCMFQQYAPRLKPHMWVGKKNFTFRYWTEVHKSYYKVMWLLRQKNKSKIVVLNTKRTKWTTVMAVSSALSVSIHMQYSPDCRDWIETEHLYFCYTTYGSVLFILHE